MSRFVESLKRSYTKGWITVLYLNELLTLEKITQEEYNYIIGE